MQVFSLGRPCVDEAGERIESVSSNKESRLAKAHLSRGGRIKVGGLVITYLFS